MQANRFLLDQLKKANERIKELEEAIAINHPSEDPIPEMNGRSFPV